MTLREILFRVDLLKVIGNTGVPVPAIRTDSRAVQTGDIFVAIRGVSNDGHEYIPQVIAAGAAAIVCESLPPIPDTGAVWVQVPNSAAALAYMAANFYENPADRMAITGVTGTNGKTTIATLLYRLFRALGYSAGLISTVENRINDDVVPATHTTPDALSLHALFARMRKAGCTHVFMEVSSHALVQHRVTGIPFAGAIFTNITRDHLDYHKTFAAYCEAKQHLFNMLGNESFALANADDAKGMFMLGCTGARKYRYGLEREADFRGKLLENSMEGILMTLDGHEAWFRLVGRFNASNLMAIYSAAVLLGERPSDVLLEMSRLEPVNGRFQTVRATNGTVGIVDYAHSPDALENVIRTILDTKGDDQKLITVMGCGGDRDRGKRPLMGKIAAELSNQVVLTSDNPRFEEPDAILDEIWAGVPVSLRRRVMRVENRKEAIGVACRLAQPGDVILVAGKGHENYQEIKGVKHPFDDLLTIQETFQTLLD